MTNNDSFDNTKATNPILSILLMHNLYFETRESKILPPIYLGYLTAACYTCFQVNFKHHPKCRLKLTAPEYFETPVKG